MNTLNENIRALRIQNGISQVELAKRLHVSKQCVSNWENDNVLPSVEMLVKLAELFAVSTDALLGRESNDTVDVSRLSSEQAAHVRMLIADLIKANDLP